jgi:uncharacterized membrane protein HdeD (DUF308 family)
VRESKTVNRIATTITDQWWLVALSGVLTVVFGVLAWAWPGITLTTLVLLFGAYAIVGGVMSLAAAVARRGERAGPWPFVFQGLLGIATGVLVFVWPNISALALIYVIAAWAFITGIVEVVAAIELRKVISNEWLLALAGIASIAFGVIAAIFPGDGALALVWTIGVYAIVFGTLQIALGFRLHGWGRRLTSATA